MNSVALFVFVLWASLTKHDRKQGKHTNDASPPPTQIIHDDLSLSQKTRSGKKTARKL